MLMHAENFTRLTHSPLQHSMLSPLPRNAPRASAHSPRLAWLMRRFTSFASPAMPHLLRRGVVHSPHLTWCEFHHLVSHSPRPNIASHPSSCLTWPHLASFPRSTPASPRSLHSSYAPRLLHGAHPQGEASEARHLSELSCSRMNDGRCSHFSVGLR